MTTLLKKSIIITYSILFIKICCCPSVKSSHIGKKPTLADLFRTGFEVLILSILKFSCFLALQLKAIVNMFSGNCLVIATLIAVIYDNNCKNFAM